VDGCRLALGPAPLPWGILEPSTLLVSEAPVGQPFLEKG